MKLWKSNLSSLRCKSDDLLESINLSRIDGLLADDEEHASDSFLRG